MSCIYYMNVKYCSKREEISEKVAKLLKDIDDIQDSIDSASPDADTTSLEESLAAKDEEINKFKSELEIHKSSVCESNDEKAKYWCDGFKICLGHRTHYRCEGHKIIVCYGHTNINVTVKIMYRDKMLEKLYEIMR